MDKSQTQAAMEACCRKYLEKYGTEGWGEFKKFMNDKGIPANNLSFVARWRKRT